MRQQLAAQQASLNGLQGDGASAVVSKQELERRLRALRKALAELRPAPTSGNGSARTYRIAAVWFRRVLWPAARHARSAPAGSTRKAFKLVPPCSPTAPENSGRGGNICAALFVFLALSPHLSSCRAASAAMILRSIFVSCLFVEVGDWGGDRGFSFLL